MELSLIISTWNNAAQLEITLEAISLCRVPTGLSWELVVVNNNCTDKTPEIIKKYNEILPVLAVYEPRQGLSYGRNAGLAAASGNWLLFTDDDVRPGRDWIRHYVCAFQQFEQGYFFGGPIYSVFEGTPPPDELLPMATKAIRGFTIEGLSEPSVVGSSFLAANWAVSSADLAEVGLFDVERGLNPARGEMRFGEETDLQTRLRSLGLEGVYLPQAGLDHFVPEAKCEPEYILSRAEATAFEAARYESQRSLPGTLRLMLSLAARYVWFRLRRMQGLTAWRECHRWRVRRGRLLGSFSKGEMWHQPDRS